MRDIQTMIDELSRRAGESDLISLLATSRNARLYNADLARQLRDVIQALKSELDLRAPSLNDDPRLANHADGRPH